MPATYAHWTFGKKCIEVMPKNLQKIIHDNREIYDLGVHGPDIFFYDLAHKEIADFGYSLHDIPAKEFFANCKKQLNAHDEKAEMLAYIMGFLSHFVLDSSCHSYVEKKKEVSNVSHNQIESQWERHLIELDNRQPNLVDRAESLKPSKKIAKVISYFYKFDSNIVYRTIRNQKFVVTALNCISERKEKVLKKILKLLKMNNNADLFIGFKEDDRCSDSNIRLDKISNKAVKLYAKQMKNLLGFLNDNEKLNSYFDYDLAARPDYKKIKVLSYNKELAYKID